MHPTTIRSATLWLGLALPLAAQAEPAAPPLLPLGEGARWTYCDVHPSDPMAIGSTVTITDEGEYHLPDGQRVHQLRVAVPAGRAPTFETWSVRPDGIYLHPTRQPGHRGALVAEAPPLRLLALPIGPREWTWTGPLASLRSNQTEWTHHATLVDAAAKVTVPAGTFTAVHVRIVSEHAGARPRQRELWFAPGVGIVRDEVAAEHSRELEAFAPGTPTRRERLLRHLDEQLANPAFPAFNNTPWIGWIDDGPEAMVLPGRIAVVKAERWCRCFYVDAEGVYGFEPTEADRTATAARAAFGGTKSAIPPPEVPTMALAQLLVRAQAERLHLARVRFVAPTLPLPRELPQERTRHAHVEVEGGAPDGSLRRVAVWLTIDRSCDIQIATDAADPWAPPRK